MSGGESKRGGGDVASEQLWQRRRRLVDERWQREAALKAAASDGVSKSMSDSERWLTRILSEA